ncbi:flavodoxin family protein [Marisediminicola senii]|uniref:flavodoxin family protein n=1 Tax=Marisediminicola senii TaxID=2711233 RepID=UPI0013ED897B|nr:flavodoxin family protein [Marisediminicola senii]
MRALVVYESLWGNTESIARAVARQLEQRMTVVITDSEGAPASIDGIDLLVVGAPTHAFSMSRPATRADAVERHGAPRTVTRGIREWLAALPRMSSAVPAATFDTRADSPRLPGSAARAARHRLRALRFDVSDGAVSFWVDGYAGPLIDGELERAAEWAAALVASAERSARVTRS